MHEQDPIFFATPAAFRRWLQMNHKKATELWVGYYKKASGKRSVTWDETVEEALCVGWIDGLRKSIDDERYMIRFTARKPKSVWSRRNIELVERLKVEGRMKPEGLQAYAGKDQHPDSGYSIAEGQGLTGDMLAQFKHVAQAWRFYQTQPPSYQRQVARWVAGAKRRETRERRLATLIADSTRGLRVKPFRRA